MNIYTRTTRAVAALIIGASALVTPVSASSDLVWNKADIEITGDYEDWNDTASSTDGTKLVATSPTGVYTSSNSGNTWTKRTVGISTGFWTIGSSADGSKLYGTIYNEVYRSTDSGETWSKIGPDIQSEAASVGLSADGTKLVTAEYDGGVYTSSDSGDTWNEQAGAGIGNWSGVSSSSDGSKLLLRGSSLMTSDDSGVTWNAVNLTGSGGWTSTTISDDGLLMAAVSRFSNEVYVSNDAGVNWTAHDLGQNMWSTIDSDADGSHLVAASTYGNSIFTSSDSGATWTERTAAGTRSWGAASISDSGAKIVIIEQYGGSVFTSSDFGASWTTHTIFGNRPWNSVASSADGNELAAVERGTGEMYTSSDAGESWTRRDVKPGTNMTLLDVAMSADGTKMIVSTAYNSLHISVNGGSTWTEVADTGTEYWQSVTMSADGTKLAAAGYGTIHTSADSGENWTEFRDDESDWRGLAASDNGSVIVAVSQDGIIHTSNDSGQTWVARPAAGAKAWFGVATDQTGQHMLASVSDESLYKSNDYGATWTELTNVTTSERWYNVASNSDGSVLAATATGDATYLSYDSGQTWTKSASPTTKTFYDIAMNDAGTRSIAGGDHVYLAKKPSLPTSVDLTTVQQSPGVDPVMSKAVLSMESNDCQGFEPGSVSTYGASSMNDSGETIKNFGGLGFTIDCSTVGGSSEVSVALNALVSDLSTVRVYKQNDAGTVRDITKDVTVANVSGKTTVSYTLVDGGALDDDGVADSKIVDPIYVAVLQGTIVGAPSTGGGAELNLLPIGIAAVSALTGITLVAIIRRHIS